MFGEGYFPPNAPLRILHDYSIVGTSKPKLSLPNEAFPFFRNLQTTKTPEEPPPPPPSSYHHRPKVGHQGTRRTAQEKSLECLDTFR